MTSAIFTTRATSPGACSGGVSSPYRGPASLPHDRATAEVLA
jgi:hypothetical protein